MKKILYVALIGLIVICALLPISVYADNKYDGNGVLMVIGQEVVSMRGEYTKTIYLGEVEGGSRYSIVANVSAVHYKNDYANPNEQWKDIDTTIVNGRVDKAPYTLTIDYPNKSVTVVDKKTGGITTLGLNSVGSDNKGKLANKSITGLGNNKANWSNVVIDTDLEITASNTDVRITRILKSNKAPLDATFDVTQSGRAPSIFTQAIIPSNPSKKVEISSSFVGGVLSETIDVVKSGGLEYPLYIDPIISVGVVSSTDDMHTVGAAIVNSNSLVFGRDTFANTYNSGMRFLNITVPNTSTITTAYIIFTASQNEAVDTVRTKIYGQQSSTPSTFSTYLDFIGRPLATATVHWDFATDWTTGTAYNSGDIKTIIQELVNDYSGLIGSDIVLFVYDDGSDAGAAKIVYSYDGYPSKSPRLYIEYTALAPEVETVNASNTLTTQSQLNSKIISDGYDDCQISWGWDTSSHSTNFTAYANHYTDMTGNYTNDELPYHALSGLTHNTTYYFNVGARNENSIDYGVEKQFTTDVATAVIGAPTYFTGISTGETISLTWVRGSSSNQTMVRYAIGSSAPTSNTTGTLLYNGGLTYYTLTGLTSGRAYSFIAWGIASTGAWSTSNATLTLSTLGSGAISDELPNVATPANMFTDTDYTQLHGVLFYDIANMTIDNMGMPRETGWLLGYILLLVAVSVTIAFKTEKLFFGFLVSLLLMAFGWLIGLIPMWMPIACGILAFALMGRGTFGGNNG